MTPWVEGSFPLDPAIEDVAQTVHGLGIVRGADGLERHQSQGAIGDYVVTEDDFIKRVEAWMARLDGV